MFHSGDGVNAHLHSKGEIMYNTIKPNPACFIINDQPVSFNKITVIEGPDGVGKTTFIRQVQDEMIAGGKDVRIIRFPDNRRSLTFRDMIMSADAGRHPSVEVFLFLADFVYTLQSEVMPYLDDDNVIFLFDRFVPSSCIYQNVTRLSVREIFEKTQPPEVLELLGKIDYLYLFPKSVNDLTARLASKRHEDLNRLDPKTVEHTEAQFNKYHQFVNEHIEDHRSAKDPLQAKSIVVVTV
jgi:thymidylate kinase